MLEICDICHILDLFDPFEGCHFLQNAAIYAIYYEAFRAIVLHLDQNPAQNPAIYAIYYGVLMAIMNISGSPNQPRILQFMSFIMGFWDPWRALWSPFSAQNPAIYAIYYGALLAMLTISGPPCRLRILQFRAP